MIEWMEHTNCPKQLVTVADFQGATQLMEIVSYNVQFEQGGSRG